MLLASSPWDLEWRFLVSWKRDEWKPEWDTRKQHTPRQKMIRKENLNEQISGLIDDRSLLTGSSFIGVDFWDGNCDELHSRYWVTRKHHQINQSKKFKFDSSRRNSMTSESYCNMTFVIVDSWTFPQRSSVGSWIVFPSQWKMVFWATEREHVPMSSQMVFEFRGWALSPARWHEPVLKFQGITCRCCQISNIGVGVAIWSFHHSKDLRPQRLREIHADDSHLLRDEPHREQGFWVVGRLGRWSVLLPLIGKNGRSILIHNLHFFVAGCCPVYPGRKAGRDHSSLQSSSVLDVAEGRLWYLSF